MLVSFRNGIYKLVLTFMVVFLFFVSSSVVERFEIDTADELLPNGNERSDSNDSHIIVSSV